MVTQPYVCFHADAASSPSPSPKPSSPSPKPPSPSPSPAPPAGRHLRHAFTFLSCVARELHKRVLLVCMSIAQCTEYIAAIHKLYASRLTPLFSPLAAAAIPCCTLLPSIPPTNVGTTGCAAGWTLAAGTVYDSWPAPNTEEFTSFSGGEWSGLFNSVFTTATCTGPGEGYDPRLISVRGMCC